MDTEIKQGVVVRQDNKKSPYTDFMHNVANYKRQALRLYLQHINPGVSKATEVIENPGNSFKKILPHDMAKWLAIAALITGAMVFISPDKYWKWQLLLFLLVFFVGPFVARVMGHVRDGFLNLLVAYPGKHLLDQVITLDQPIVDGFAEVELHGEKWKIEGENYPAGTTVRVIAINDGVLFVVVDEQA